MIQKSRNCGNLRQAPHHCNHMWLNGWRAAALSTHLPRQNKHLLAFILVSRWLAYSTPNHWSYEIETKEYAEKIIPCIKRKCSELNLSDDHSALAIFDVFRGQMTAEVFALLDHNSIHVVKVPVNCTDQLQPIDLSINKSVKEFVRKKFQQWYAGEVEKQMDQGMEHAPVDLAPVNPRMSIMKPLGARWLVSLHDYFQESNSILKNGFVLPIYCNNESDFDQLCTQSMVIIIVIIIIII